MKLSRLLMVVVSVSILSSLASARGVGREHGHRDELAIEKQFSLEKLKDLDLSGDQKEKLKELRKAHKDDANKFRDEFRAAKKSFKEALRSKAGKEEVLKAYDAMMEKKTQLGKSRMNGLLEAREVLTPDQRMKLFDNKDD